MRLLATVVFVSGNFGPSPYCPQEDQPSPPSPVASDEPAPVALGAPRPVRSDRVKVAVAVALIAVGAAAAAGPDVRDRLVLEQVSERALSVVWEVSCTSSSERHRGTGFVLETSSGPLLLTNWHVVRQCVSQKDGRMVSRLIEAGRPSSQPRLAEVVEALPDLDAAFLSASSLPAGVEVGPAPSLGQRLAVVGHPGDARDVSVSGRVVKLEVSTFILGLSVERGSSGSPALDADGRAVGLVSAKLVGGFQDAAMAYSLSDVCAAASAC